MGTLGNPGSVEINSTIKVMVGMRTARRIDCIETLKITPRQPPTIAMTASTNENNHMLAERGITPNDALSISSAVDERIFAVKGKAKSKVSTNIITRNASLL